MIKKFQNLILTALILSAFFITNTSFAEDLNLNINATEVPIIKEEPVLTEKNILLKVPNLNVEVFVRLDEFGLNTDLSLDGNKTRDILENKINPLLPKAQNARFVIEGKNLNIEEAKSGYTVDIEQTINDFLKNIESLKLDELEIKLKIVEAELKSSSLEQYKDYLNENLINLNLKIENEVVAFKKEDYISLIELKGKKEIKCDFFDKTISIKIEEDVILPDNCKIKEGLKMNLNEEAFKKYKEDNLSKFEIKPQDVKIYYDENDKIVFEGTATNGKEINTEALSGLIGLAIEKSITDIPVPLKTTRAKVDSDEKIKALGITELVATGWSNFAGSSAARIYNVKFGMEKYNGLMIKAGEQFSFNENLGGPVTNATGWKSELVIKGNQTIPEAGGGLCQVSTTFYRAAFFGGYQIDERSGHSYAVSYYANPDYGMDCTVYPGSKDCVITNNSDYNILIQTYTEGLDAYFKFYSTSDGRSVEMEGPYYYGYSSASPINEVSASLAPGQKKLVENAHTGFSVDLYRTVTKNGLRGKKENFHTSYRAVPAKYLVGPSTSSEVATTSVEPLPISEFE